MATFPYFRLTSNGGGTLSGLFHTRKDAGTGSQRGWVPIETELTEGTLYTPTAMAGGSSLSYQAQFNDAAGANIGGIVTLTGNGVDQSVRATMNATLTAVGTGTNAESEHCQRSATGAGATFDMYKGYGYIVNTFANDNITWLSAGDAAFNWTISGSDNFYGFGWSGTTSNGAVAGTRLPIPCDGELQYFMMRYSLTAANSATFAVQVNSADSAFSYSLLAANTLTTDNSTTVAVSRGDLINIRYIRTAGAATTFSGHCMLGFRASS